MARHDRKAEVIQDRAFPSQAAAAGFGGLLEEMRFGCKGERANGEKNFEAKEMKEPPCVTVFRN